MCQRLSGQTAIVTGAGSPQGIGFAIARRLHAAGAHVVITSTTDRIHQRARELDKHGDRVSAFVADLTSESAVQQAVREVLARTHRIDVLVNNAGMAQTGNPIDSVPLRDSSYVDWKRQIEITLHTAFLMTRAVLPSMTERKYGRIVNVSSVTGPLVSNPGSSAYGAAKAAMDGMMRAVAIETGRDGITINAVAPGWIETASSTDSERVAALTPPWDAPALLMKWRQQCASWLHPKRPTSPDNPSSSMAETSCRRRRVVSQTPVEPAALKSQIVKLTSSRRAAFLAMSVTLTSSIAYAGLTPSPSHASQ